MALVQYTGGVLKFTGSVSGMTFQQTGAGNVLRVRARPKLSSTSKQQASHQTHIKRLQEWQLLSPSQKASWNLFASLYPKTNKVGTSKKLNGQNWFESCNTLLEIIGQPTISNPPPHELPQAIPSFTISIFANTINLHFTSGTDNGTSSLLIWMTYITSRSTFSINQIRKLVTVIPGNIFDDQSLAGVWASTMAVPVTTISNSPGKTIILCCQTINKISGIASTMLCAKGEIPTVPPVIPPETMYYYL